MTQSRRMLVLRAVVEDYSLGPKAIVLRGPAMPGQAFEVLPVS